MSATARTLQQEFVPQKEQTPMTGTGKPGTVVTLQTISVAFPKKSLVFGILSAFCLCFLILMRYGAIAELNMDIGRMNRQHETLKETGRMLKVEIESGLALDRIRDTAETQLDMHAPATNQVIAVAVPKSAYSVVTDPAYIEQAGRVEKNVWNRLVEMMDAVMP